MKTSWANELVLLKAQHDKIGKKINCLEELVRLEEEHTIDTDVPTSYEDPVIFRGDNHVKVRRSRIVSPVPSGKSMKLPNLLETIGQQHPHSMKYEKLAELVLETGYKTNSGNLSNMVYQCLQKLCKRGVFTKNDSTREYQFSGKID
jgi:hypothetical protein